MKGRVDRTPRKLPVLLGKILLRWIFTKADIVFFAYRFIWYACHLQVRSPMNSSVDFFESLIDEDGRFAELNCQQTQRGHRQRARQLAQAENINNGGGLSLSPPHTISQRETGTQVSQCYSGPPSPCGSTNSAPSPTVSPAPPPGTATLDPNWQATKPTVRERNAAMFNNQLMSDVTFIVGGQGHSQVIPAHKYVLATASSVFYAMFYGGLAECKQEIEVPDVEPSAFLTLLKYLYCDEIQLEADTVLSTLYVAKKYIVPYLARACVSYLETSLTAKNACLLLSQSRLFEEPELMQRCWEVIDAQVCQSNENLATLCLEPSSSYNSILMGLSENSNRTLQSPESKDSTDSLLNP